jgi:hypothetical protein
MNDMVAGTVNLTFTSHAAAAGLIGGTAEASRLDGRGAARGPPRPRPRIRHPGLRGRDLVGRPSRRGIPDAVRARLNAAYAPLAEDVSPLAGDGGRRAQHLPPEEADRYVLTDLARWREVAGAANIRVE